MNTVEVCVCFVHCSQFPVLCFIASPGIQLHSIDFQANLHASNTVPLILAQLTTELNCNWQCHTCITSVVTNI